MTGHVLASMNEVISYDYSYEHKAVDIVGAGNSVDDVIAFDDGVVEIVVNNVRYTDHNSTGTATYGNFVKIRHNNGTKTLYAHMKYGSISVYSGQNVYKGQKIGTMGATGNAYGTHLHFEVRNSDESRLDPKDYLYQKQITEIANNEESKNISEDSGGFGENTDSDTLTSNVDSDDSVDDSGTSSLETDDDKTETIDDILDSKFTLEDYNIAFDDEEIGYVEKLDKDNDNPIYLSNKKYYEGSIVDALKAIDENSSFDNRSDIAYSNGIKNYSGTYSQNLYLLNLLKQGKLKI